MLVPMEPSMASPLCWLLGWALGCPGTKKYDKLGCIDPSRSSGASQVSSEGVKRTAIMRQSVECEMPATRISHTLTLVLLLLLGGCAGRPAPEAESKPVPDETEQVLSAEPSVSPVATTRHDRFWVPPLFATEEDEVHYYISRLADRRFIDVYGGEEHPRVWYIAAERLGQIGEPAIPMLFSLLDTHDEYELMLALYALQLATQDPRLMAQTGGDYVSLTTTLDVKANAENRTIALEWWERHGWRWQ
ncbi:hypothetical protein [Billgrantia sp. C5P2]|uniref:hypothetical protein n=1 Tax=Billgrantia sp. C5P2 TaxID=3436239 RepID=UPI003DA41AA5